VLPPGSSTRRSSLTTTRSQVLPPPCPAAADPRPPRPRQGCSLPLASLPRDGLRPPLTRSVVPGVELANSRAGRTVPFACHIRRATPVPSGQPRLVPQRPKLVVSSQPDERVPRMCLIGKRSGRPCRPASHRPRCGLNAYSVGIPPCRWPETARLYRGMSLAQTPPGLPLNKAIARAGLACRGQPAGVYLASQGPPGGAPLPPRAGRLWSTVGPRPMGTDRYAAVIGGRSFRKSLVPSWESGPGEEC
jgi:hypothetical protein